VPLAAATAAEAIRWAAAANRRVVAATPDAATPWHEVRLTGDALFVVGSEAEGLSAAWTDAARAGTIALEMVSLPMRGVADSLNVAATAAVLAFEAVRQEMLP
jgi:TrmH family RNA methyltransferase